jgi:hypothetical protein
LAKPVAVDCVAGTSSLPDRLAENVSPSCAWIELKDKEVAATDMVAANIAIIVNLCCCDIKIR